MSICRRTVLLLAGAMLCAAAAGGQDTPPPALKAAFLVSFARFTEWPTESSRSDAVVLCVVGDDDVAAALGGAVRGKTIAGRRIAVVPVDERRFVRACHLLFVGRGETRASSVLADAAQGPVLTVSDAAGFNGLGGMIELFVEDGRMRFAVNLDAVSRASLRLSSKVLALASNMRMSP